MLMRKEYFSNIPFILLSLSLPLGTVSIGSIGGANIRIWEILLLPSVIILVLSIQSNVIAYLSRNMWGFAVLFYGVILVSSVNTYTNLDLFIKQALLMFGMIVLFFVTSVQRIFINGLAITRSIIYSGLVVSIIALMELFYNPNPLQTFYFGDLILSRARAYFAEANEYSQYLGLPFSFLVATLIFNKKIIRLERIIFSIGLLLIVSAQLLTLSRGGILVFVANLFALFCIMKYCGLVNINLLLKSPLVISCAVVTAIFIFYFSGELIYLNLFQERFLSIFSGDDATTNIRFESQLLGFNYVTDSVISMLFGIGFGNLPVLLGEGAATTANFLSDIFIETGVVGLTFLLLLIANIMNINRYKSQLLYSSLELRPIFVASYMALFGLLVGGLTYASHMLNFFWFICGLVVACHVESYRLVSLIRVGLEAK